MAVFEGMRRRISAPALTGLTWLAIGSLLLTGCTQASASSAIPSNATKVLQSVSVSMAPDGAITALSSAAVSTDGTPASASIANNAFSPAEDAKDLPFRVLTSYRTNDKAGTDLSELTGYTGQLEIDLTVENLTVKPQTLTYDVAGESRSQTALVGVPLTVMASTQLAGTPSSSVVTAGASNATNGILSQTPNGEAIVQWAAILAPPQLSSSTTLRLLVNAKDFKAPAFNVSVQPGLVTDPSLGTLLDSVFAPNSADQYQLQTHTIELIGEVNAVLAKAAKAINKVSSNLDDTSHTLGTRAVGDLKSSVSEVSSSMQSLDSRIKQLKGQLAQSLNSSRSSVVQSLAQAVGIIDAALGDTSEKPPTLVLGGSGCAAVPADAPASKTVYGNLMRVVAQLNGYAAATTACKVQIQASLLDAVGPATPSAARCVSDSVTCSLFTLKQDFGAIADKLVLAGDNAVSKLNPKVLADANSAYQTVSDDISAVVTKMAAVKAATPFSDVTADLDAVAALVGSGATGTLPADLDALASQIATIHASAVAAGANESKILTKNSDVAGKICRLVDGGSLSLPDAESVLNELTGKDCSGHTFGSGTPLSTMLQTQIDAWTSVAAATDAGVASDGLGKALATLRADLAAAQARVATAKADATANATDLSAGVNALNLAVGQLNADNATLSPLMSELSTQQSALAASVRGSFATAAAEAKASAAAAVDPRIRQIADRATTDAATLGAMFDRSASGLAGASSTITQEGSKVVDGQKAQVASAAATASATISDQVTAGLAEIDTSVNAASKDLAGASTLLTNDLKAVLLDLGTRKVKGAGLLGAMSTSSATADSANFQLALASQTASSYANVRAADVSGILLRQAQTNAGSQALASQALFKITGPASAEHRTVYAIQIGSK